MRSKGFTLSLRCYMVPEVIETRLPQSDDALAGGVATLLLQPRQGLVGGLVGAVGVDAEAWVDIIELVGDAQCLVPISRFNTYRCYSHQTGIARAHYHLLQISVE